MNLNPDYIDRGKDPRRESLIKEQLESGLLKRHPDKEKEVTVRKLRFDNYHVIQLLNTFLMLDISARKFERSNGLAFGLISKAKREFIDNNIHTELVGRLNNK